MHSGYGEIEIIHGVSMEVREEEVVSIIGPNGSGKSTLMKTIFGLLTPTEGSVYWNEEDISDLKPNQIVRKQMSYVPQTSNIFQSLTVTENLNMGAFIREDDYSDRIREIFEIFPQLEGYRNQYAGKLSGGEQQMVAMGRALMLEPTILLLDEPSAGLAPNLVDMILERVEEINRTGVALLIVEQNAKDALEISDRGYVLAMGRKEYEDTAQGLLENEEVGELYLGG